MPLARTGTVSSRANAADVFLACTHAIALMARSAGSAIVNRCLCSVASLTPTPFITGQGLAIDGGFTLARMLRRSK